MRLRNPRTELPEAWASSSTVLGPASSRSKTLLWTAVAKIIGGAYPQTISMMRSGRTAGLDEADIAVPRILIMPRWNFLSPDRREKGTGPPARTLGPASDLRPVPFSLCHRTKLVA